MSPITRRWQRDLDRAAPLTNLVIGSKVRRIDEPSVVLRVREIDPEGLIDGTPKALCVNSFAHGKWMPLADLEVSP